MTATDIILCTILIRQELFQTGMNKTLVNIHITNDHSYSLSLNNKKDLHTFSRMADPSYYKIALLILYLSENSINMIDRFTFESLNNL